MASHQWCCCNPALHGIVCRIISEGALSLPPCSIVETHGWETTLGGMAACCKGGASHLATRSERCDGKRRRRDGRGCTCSNAARGLQQRLSAPLATTMAGVTRLAYVLQHNGLRVAAVRRSVLEDWWFGGCNNTERWRVVHWWLWERGVGDYSCEKKGKMRKGTGTCKVGEKRCIGPWDTCCVHCAVESM